jgi:broad specificity phosphatase PhoE
MLTDAGKVQCLELRESFPFLQEVEVILVSPLRRAIQTAAFVFGPEMERRGLPIILVPQAQEISSLQCDIGQDAEAIRSEAAKLIAEAAPGWNAELLDSTLVDDGWNSKVGICPESRGNDLLNEV